MDKKLAFPKGFLLGTATASYQVEGAYNEDGKSENIWDRYTHEKNGRVFNNENGDVAIDHYHRLEEDLDYLKELGCKIYRFSLSWSRIIPLGTGEVNKKGIDFYNRLINGLIKRNIVPAATIYHWDLPVVLQDKGGWANREIVNWYKEYAKVCFDNFSDRVKYWFTLNEPYSFLLQGYGYGAVPPCITNWKTAIQATHNALIAHGTVVKLFKDGGYKGKIGIALDLIPKIPYTAKEEDKEAAEIANQTSQFWFYDAIIKGKYPEKAMEIYKEKGYAPEIAQGDMEIISQKLDFLGVNFYLVQQVIHKEGAGEFDYEILDTEDWNNDAEGFYKLLMQVSADTDKKLPILISENGMFSMTEKIWGDGKIHDEYRIEYLRLNMSAALRAINDGANLFGYAVWTAFDNFEWNKGTSFRFGLVYVDYENNYKRTIKESGKWFRSISDSIPE